MKQPRHLLLPLILLAVPDDCRAELVAHYKFDEAAAAPTALNEVPGSSTGAVGANITTGIDGISGKAYSFVGATATQADCVDMANASFFPALDATGKLTFSAWVKTADTTGNRNCVVFAGDNTQTNIYADLGVAAGQAGFLGAASARNRPAGSPAAQQTGIFSSPAVPPVNDDAWHHLVMTVDLSTAKLDLWVDGVLANTQTMGVSLFPVFNNFEIGRLGRGAPVDPYSGLVDDVQVYDQALNSAQINYLKNNPGLSYNPALLDLDGDGRTDFDELNTPPLTDPSDPDSDNDGLNDGAEVNTHLTDPNNPDSDFDDLPDAWEVANTLNPNSADGDDGRFGDPDMDGLDNIDEYFGGVGSTNPRDADSDDDGYTDLQEDRIGFWGDISLTGTDPNNPDTDGDGFLDGQENPDLEYVEGMTPGTDPNDYDTDDDGYNDKGEFLANSNPDDGGIVPVAARGLVAHYKFDEPAAATVAASALGDSPGTVGASVVTGVTGVAGNAYQFGGLIGQADIVDMGNTLFLTEILATKAMTYTAWIKSTDVSSGRNVAISASNSTLVNSYVDMGIAGAGGATNGALFGRLRPNGNGNIGELFSNTAPSTVLVNDDAWHHVALTVDLASTSIKLYVDGVMTGENNAIPLAVFPIFNNFEIGRLGRNVPTDGYQGLVDDVQIYNEALPAARIADLFAMPGKSTDEDHDRLDDQWEIARFGNIEAEDGSGDPDNDGISNEDEETAGTFPGGLPETPVAAKVGSVSFVAGGNYVINFTGAPDTTYRVTKSTETLDGFTEMEPPLTATTDGNGVGVATVPAVEATGPRNFYRLEAP